MSRIVSIIFPHQLFAESPLPLADGTTYLVEEFLFFKHYAFHKQKIAFHRATMQAYKAYLVEKEVEVVYVTATEERSDIRVLLQQLGKEGALTINYIDPTDDWLERRIKEGAGANEMTVFDNPLFINTKSDNASFFREDKKSFFQTTFYKQQRERLQILLEKDGSPVGGKWTYDVDNRKKYPKGKIPPAIHFPASSAYWQEAVEYVETHFADNFGQLSADPLYPITFTEAEAWYQQFLDYRFYDFGAYEDAIVDQERWLHHSILTPVLNVGLIRPQTVVDQALAFAEKEDIPLNSTEGFVRQIIGWREFIRGMYECKGRPSRTTNFWGFKRKIPASFYDGTTGIVPIDQTIKKLLETGYSHHIERLMILGNFMLLCEFDPDEVYRWFMELFIDAYDWVMVPNVYGMSQFADGGLFATKPYISGSNYLKKMSNYPKGPWQAIWDGLFWRFIDQHQAFFLKNPRLAMMARLYQRMPEEKRTAHLVNAEEFLAKL